MVGLVIVSHSRAVAEGVGQLARQMAPGETLVVATAGGDTEGGLGTDFQAIAEAVELAELGDGALVLFDLGSALLTTEMVLESLPLARREKVRLCPAPLVEGALAAVPAMAAGAELAEVYQAACQALFTPKLPDEAPQALPEPGESCDPAPQAQAQVVVPNPQGLHARPAILLVQAAARFQSRITLQNLSRGQAPVDAKQPLALSLLGAAAQGDTVALWAQGPDAKQAVDDLRRLVAEGFGEMDEAPPTSATNTGPSPSGRALSGIGVSPGVVLGPLHQLDSSLIQAPQGLLTARGQGPKEEFERLSHAMALAGKDLEVLENRLAGQAGRGAAMIIRFQRMILEDPNLLSDLNQHLRDDDCTAEAAVWRVWEKWLHQALSAGGHTGEQAADLRDLRQRLLTILAPDMIQPPRLPDRPVILAMEELSPSLAALLSEGQVAGIACVRGTQTAHAAILARTWGIPAVMGLGPELMRQPQDREIALDGGEGLLILEPDQDTRHRMERQGQAEAQLRRQALRHAQEPAVTTDGRRVLVMANASDPASVHAALAAGADGIGLVRTEFLFLGRSTPPDEKEQMAVYRQIMEAAQGRPVVFRTLDIGGDKPAPWLDLPAEDNPFLGLRGIRLSLAYPELLTTQLRAILRAGAGGWLKIMFPMVTGTREVRLALGHLAQARESLVAASLDHAEEVERGVMIETPAAALKAAELAGLVDFFSLGTNDLTQYTMAADRTNPALKDIYDPGDPAVLELMRRTALAAQEAGIQAAICGDLAGDAQALELLVGLGLEELSVTAPQVALVKARVRRLDFAACRDKVIAQLGA